MLNKTKTIKLIAVIGIVACLAMPAWYYAAQQDQTQVQSTNKKLTLEITTKHNNYLQLEPIILEFKLSNQTDIPLGHEGILSAKHRNVKFLVRSENQDTTTHSFEEPGYYFPNFTVFQPGAVNPRGNVLEAEILETLFPHPGKYEIQVNYSYYSDESRRQAEMITSNWISIHILEPHGINREAFKYIKETIQPEESKVKTNQMIEVLQHFVDKYRNSIYAKYYALKLADRYELKGEYAKAEKELCKIRNINFSHSWQVERILQKLANKLRPMPIIPNLPEDAPRPPRPQPCVEQQTP